MEPLLTIDDPLVTGQVVDRPNRFVVRVRFDDDPERVFLGDPGALEDTLEPGRELLCRPVDDPERTTGYDAIAVDVDGTYVSVRASLANALFERALAADALAAFEGYDLLQREPPYPDHGRADFRLGDPAGTPVTVEVKSCTHVDDGVAKFPDRQTERGDATSPASKPSSRTTKTPTSSSSSSDPTSTDSARIARSIPTSPTSSAGYGLPASASTRFRPRSSRRTTGFGTTTSRSTWADRPPVDRPRIDPEPRPRPPRVADGPSIRRFRDASTKATWSPEAPCLR